MEKVAIGKLPTNSVGPYRLDAAGSSGPPHPAATAVSQRGRAEAAVGGRQLSPEPKLAAL